MELTKKNKKTIDDKSYEQLLSHWRFAPSGDLWFQGETGDYWAKRMKELKSRPGGQEKHVKDSKSLGWG